MTPDPIKMRKKRDTHLKRQAILTGAVNVFIESGYELASMDRIAEVAGVSKRTVYNHFQSKESLFEAVVEDFLRQRDEQKPIEYSKLLTLEAQLKQFAEAELFLINDPIRRGLSKFLTSIFLMDIEYGKKVRAQSKPPHAGFVRWLDAAKTDGKLDFESPQMAARIFYGLVEGCLTYGALFTDGESLKQKDVLLDEIVTTFLCRYRTEKVPED